MCPSSMVLVSCRPCRVLLLLLLGFILVGFHDFVMIFVSFCHSFCVKMLSISFRRLVACKL